MGDAARFPWFPPRPTLRGGRVFRPARSLSPRGPVLARLCTRAHGTRALDQSARRTWSNVTTYCAAGGGSSTCSRSSSLRSSSASRPGRRSSSGPPSTPSPYRSSAASTPSTVVSGGSPVEFACLVGHSDRSPRKPRRRHQARLHRARAARGLPGWLKSSFRRGRKSCAHTFGHRPSGIGHRPSGIGHRDLAAPVRQSNFKTRAGVAAEHEPAAPAVDWSRVRGAPAA